MVYKKYLEGVYKSFWLSCLINHWAGAGRKNSLEKIIYLNLKHIKSKIKSSPLFFLYEVLEKIKPIIGLKVFLNKNKKIKKIKALPHLLNTLLQYKKAIFWLVKSIKIRKEKNLFLKINNELYDTFNSTGNSLKKKGDYYKNISLFKTIKKFKW